MIKKGKEEKSWVSHEVKIWIVMKKEEKRQGFAEVKIWIVMNIENEDKRATLEHTSTIDL